MRSNTYAGAVLLSLVLVGGCIVGDQLTTLTIHPDGSAELVLWRSNLRSTEAGERAAKELAEYQASFAAQTAGDFGRIRESGGEVAEAGWVSREAPFANFVRARFPDAEALEKYLTLKSDDGRIAAVAHFRRDGRRRSLSIEITVRVDKAKAAPSSPPDVESLKQAMANGISETRLAVTGGAIATARGFTVAGDKQSALVDASAIDEVIRSGGTAELYLEWELAASVQ